MRAGQITPDVHQCQNDETGYQRGNPFRQDALTGQCDRAQAESHEDGEAQRFSQPPPRPYGTSDMRETLSCPRALRLNAGRAEQLSGDDAREDFHDLPL